VHAVHEILHGSPAPNRGVALMHRRQLQEKRFKILIANSNLMKKEVMSRFGVPDDKIRVVYPGCDLARFRVNDRLSARDKTRAALNLLPHQIAIGLVTSGDLKKRGVNIFIETLARLSSATRDKTVAVLIGKDAQLKPYQAEIRKLGLGDRFRFAPPIAAVENYYHALDIFFYPALFEEFGLSVLEAMACGLPILTSRRVGATELMTGAVRDFYPNKPDAAVFSGHLESWVNDANLLRRLAMEGPGFCAQNTWDRYTTSVMGIYKSLLSKSSVTP
jgi:UDP-glucose:(heptosyl)LPS alpha-1,3-glucosyltransferase